MSHRHFAIDERESILKYLRLGLSKAKIARKLNKHRSSIGRENGKEFSKFKEVEEKLGVTCYFANLYYSRERGTNENTDGLIRRCFPKGIDLKTLTKEDINKVV